MPRPSRIARARRPRCESLEGRVLPAAALDYPRLASAMRAATEAAPPAALSGPPRSLALDLDGDGLVDRAELSSLPGGGDRLDVFRARRDGALELARQTTLSHVAWSLLAGDYDADGRPDLFAVGEAPGQGTLLLNRGGGAFEVCQRGPVGMGLAVGDLTGDGVEDFVFANPALDRVVVDVPGLGKALLADAPAGAIAPGAVHLADLDGDGRLDLLVSTGAGLLVYPGLGDGRFGEEVGAGLGLAGAGPARVTVAYLNDRSDLDDSTEEGYDPYPDLIVTNVGEGTVSVFLGEGGWRMRPSGVLWAGPSPSSVLPGDVTGDGLPDLVVTSGVSGSVRILPGLGGGRFDDHSPRVLPAGLWPISSFLADFDGDHRADLAVVNAGSNDVTVYPDVASGRLPAVTVASGGDGPVAALLRDVNGDGLGDLVVAHRGDGRLSLLLGGAAGLNLAETVTSPAGHLAALAPSQDPWKVYVAGEDGEEASLVSFAPLLPGPQAAPGSPGGHDIPALAGPQPEAMPRLEPLSVGAVGLFPTLITPLHEDASSGPPVQVEGEGDADEAAPVRAKAAANLSGGGDEGAGFDEAREPTAAVTAEQAVQRFLLGVEDAPPPAIPIDDSATAPRVTEGPPAPTPLAMTEDEPPTRDPGVPPPEGMEPPGPVSGPPDEDATVEAVLLLVALAVTRDRPVRGRRGDRAAW